MVAVTARIEGRDLGSTIADVRRTLQSPGLVPSGITYDLGGLYQQQQIAFRGLLMVMVAAILLVFLLLLFLYERFRIAIAMLAVMLLAIASVMIGLWITKTELNITSIMGMTMIVGIVTEVSVFYASEYADTSPDLSPHQRLIAAGSQRARAIAMTTIAAILALLPLALGIGEGSAMLQPLAIAIISGLIAQMPLVLIVLPALLALVRTGRSRSSRAGVSPAWSAAE
jgi:multidrug efflux pump subunit AcrB